MGGTQGIAQWKFQDVHGVICYVEKFEDVRGAIQEVSLEAQLMARSDCVSFPFKFGPYLQMLQSLGLISAMRTG